jgi:hypothetical protein
MDYFFGYDPLASAALRAWAKCSTSEISLPKTFFGRSALIYFREQSFCHLLRWFVGLLVDFVIG